MANVLTGWCILWRRAHNEYPSLTANIADEAVAVQYAKAMIADGTAAEVIAVCSEESLRGIPSVFPPKPPVAGEVDVCQSCRVEIRFTGRVWEHVGSTPRHPAVPGGKLIHWPGQPDGSRLQNKPPTHPTSPLRR